MAHQDDHGTARAEPPTTTDPGRGETYFRSLVHASADAVVVLDDDLRVTSASPAHMPRSAASSSRVGGRLPMHATAVGKVILAFEELMGRLFR